MAHQYYLRTTGPWDVDRPPVDQDEACLQQALWDNCLYLTDLNLHQITLLICARLDFAHYIHEEFNV